MTRREGLDIKKKILDVLKQHGEVSLRELETKTNTNNITIQKHVEELEFFGKVVVTKHPKNDKNGRPFTTVRLK